MSCGSERLPEWHGRALLRVAGAGLVIVPTLPAVEQIANLTEGISSMATVRVVAPRVFVIAKNDLWSSFDGDLPLLNTEILRIRKTSTIEDLTNYRHIEHCLSSTSISNAKPAFRNWQRENFDGFRSDCAQARAWVT